MDNDKLASLVEEGGKKSEKGMSSFMDSEMLPHLWLNDEQLPTAIGLKAGDKVTLTMEAEVCRHSFCEESEGETHHDYSFKLVKGVVKKNS